MRRSQKIRVALKTRGGPEIGTGHIQRMAALMWHCRENPVISPYLPGADMPDFFPDAFKKRTSDTGAPDLILRDMRDSTIDEMEELRRGGPVVALDDLGEGARRADVRINLLPLPDSDPAARDAAVPDLFLYGYTFYRSLERIRKERYRRTIDFAFYPGSGRGDEFISSVVSLLPPGSSCIVLRGGESQLLTNGVAVETAGAGEYAELLLRTRIVISHFGITLYEAKAAGCELVSLNPTDYHSRLSDRAPSSLDILNLGTWEKLSRKEASALLGSRLASCRAESTDPGKVLEDLRSRLDGFCVFLTNSFERNA